MSSVLAAAARQFDNASLVAHDAAYAVDTLIPGEILCVSFAFVSWDKPPNFDFYGRMKKLEATYGVHLNKVLLRDASNSWYQRGIDGLGASINEVVDELRRLIEVAKPKKTIFIGQSMGAYAAVMFGALLQIDKVIAFGPLSFLDSAAAMALHDRRWLEVMLKLDRDPPQQIHRDLPALCRQQGPKPELQIFYGTKTNEGADQPVNMDAMHAFRYAALPNCKLHFYPQSGHAVVHYLIETRQINALLAEQILDVPSLGSSIPEAWISWLQENVQRGADHEELIGVMIKNNLDEGASRRALEHITGAAFHIHELKG